MAGVRDQISLGADPNPANAANAYGTGWDVGDYVLTLNRAAANEAARVLQVSLAEDDNGALSVLPDLSSLLEQNEVRTQRWLTRMADGTMNGTSAVASPIVTPEWVPGRRPTIDTSGEFSWNPISTTRNGPWWGTVQGRLAQIKFRRSGDDLTGDMVVAIIVNGVTLDEATIPSGAEESTFGGSGVDFGPADQLDLQVTTLGGGDSMTARVIHAHYH